MNVIVLALLWAVGLPMYAETEQPRSQVVFYSDFSSADPRWKTRHTPNPDLPAGESAPKYTDSGRLQMRLREWNGVVHTSHLHVPDQSFVFGRFEARMRFPSPKGAHSAFWLQDVDSNRVGGSEVDVVEHFGSDTKVWQNVYWRTEDTPWPDEPHRWQHAVPEFNPRDWHVYRVDWSARGYVFRVDGKVTAVNVRGVSSSPKVMVLSLLSSEWEWPNLQQNALHKYKTAVDWVRVMQ